MEFEINSSLSGISYSKTITITENKTNGFFIPDYAYLQKDIKYLLFLKKTENGYRIVNGTAGVYYSDAEEDIKNIISANKNKNNLFAEESANDLIELYKRIKDESIKLILLYDLKMVLSKDNSGFIEEIFYSENTHIKLYGIEQAGFTQNPKLKPEIEKLLISSKEHNIRLYSILALGEYKDKNNVNLILSFLNDKEKGIRMVSLETLSRFKDSFVIDELVNFYPNEHYFGNRITIIDAILLQDDKEKNKNLLKKLKETEKDPLVLSILTREIDKP